MQKRKSLLISLFLFLGYISTYAQHVAINNNILFDIGGVLSAGIDVPFSKRTSMEVYGSIRPWKRGEVHVNKHWLLQAQCRLWPCQMMNGFFWGPYVHGGEYNIGHCDMFVGLVKNLKDYRYEGWLAGGGIGVGYQFALAKHWNLGAEIGAGYTYIKYKKYDCEVCGALLDDDHVNYFGISKLALSVIYIF